METLMLILGIALTVLGGGITVYGWINSSLWIVLGGLGTGLVGAAFIGAGLSLVMIGEREVGIVVKKFSTRSLPAGRLVALNGEAGYQADTLDLGFVLTCAQRALAQATPEIWNSDQGRHFTSPQYTDLLLSAGVQISMDGRGRARDNIFTERLWRTVKYEEVYLTEYAHPREAQGGLSRYFPFYNHARPHQALDYRTPAAVYFSQGPFLPTGPVL